MKAYLPVTSMSFHLYDIRVSESYTKKKKTYTHEHKNKTIYFSQKSVVISIVIADRILTTNSV